jgi:hypothetical protein
MFYRMPFYLRAFKLGGLYISQGAILKFIKVTRKGFNLLDVERSVCIMKRHLYSRDFSGKEIPLDIKVVKNVLVPDYMVFKDYEDANNRINS